MWGWGYGWLKGRFSLGADARKAAEVYGGPVHSGKPVTAGSVLQLAAAWACIRVTAQAVSMLPLQLFEKDAKGSRNALPDHPLAEIIVDSPNADMTALEYWEAVVAWLCTWGNSYSEIVKSGDRVTALNLLPADRVMVTRNEQHELRYAFTDRGKREEFPAEKIFHVKGFGFGGDLGLSPIRYGTQVFGNSIAAEEAAGKVLGSGLSSSGAITTDQILTPEQRAQIAESMKKYSGSSNAGRLMLLEAGTKYVQLSINPEDQQLLETRLFHVEDICRFFGTPPVVIGHAANGITAWGSGIEALLIQWLTVGLNPFMRRIEARIRKQLLAPADRRRIYVEFNREALLQADSAAKATFLSQMTQNGLMTRNEGRAKLNLPRVDGGDALTAQTNLAPLDRLGAADPRADMRNALGIED